MKQGKLYRITVKRPGRPPLGFVYVWPGMAVTTAHTWNLLGDSDRVSRKSARQEKFQSQVDKGLEKSGHITANILQTFYRMNMQPKAAYLRIRSATCFDVMIIVPSAVYLSERMLGALGFLSQVEREEEKEDFEINFSTADVKDLNSLSAQGSLMSNGYMYSFEHDPKELYKGLRTNEGDRLRKAKNVKKPKARRA